jgi:hypothetical protein
LKLEGDKRVVFFSVLKHATWFKSCQSAMLLDIDLDNTDIYESFNYERSPSLLIQANESECMGGGPLMK